MNRTERLYAIVSELRSRAPRAMRAAELAARLEVTTRTIERDLLALQEAGVPIWARPGPGGGYSVDADTTLPPLNLTSAEAAAIATALAAARAMPFAGAGRSALTKLASVMAAASRDDAARLVSQVRVASGPGTAARRVSDAVQRALTDSVALDITYRDASGAGTQRTVEPAGIVGTLHGWYLLAWCRLREGPRFFKLDRIERASPTTETIQPRLLDEMVAALPFDVTAPAFL